MCKIHLAFLYGVGDFWSGGCNLRREGCSNSFYSTFFLPLDTASTTNKYNVFSKGADIDNIYVTAFTFNLPHILFSEYND